MGAVENTAETATIAFSVIPSGVGESLTIFIVPPSD